MIRVLSFIKDEQIKKAFAQIGTDDEGIKLMLPKSSLWLVKVANLDSRAANILKQEMLSKGGDVALSKDVAYKNAPTTDVILIGTAKQYKALYQKLKLQPFKLAELAEQIRKAIENFGSYKKLKIGRGEFDFSKRTYLMGILNVTPDSFSDGGQFFNQKVAVKHALMMVGEGADIIDVGGESTQPGSEPVALGEELNRVIPVIKEIRKETGTPVSIDSYKPQVVEAALEAGADMVNDVTGLRDERMLKLVAKANLPTCIMHMLGEPKTMQEAPQYKEVVEDIYLFLMTQAKKAQEAGLDEQNILIDPGIGFGKTLEHNLEIIRRLRELKSAGYPVVLGTSRKSFIGMILDLDVTERLEGTAASVALGIANGADIIRIHDVGEMKRVAMVADTVVK